MGARRRLAVFGIVAVLLAAGSAAAFWALSRKDVTTSSKEALRLYQQGVENEQKMYMREALESYAAALGKDPHFVMATLRLANALYGRDPERARSLVESAARYRDDVSERERLMIDLFRAQMSHDRARRAALVDEYVRRFPSYPEGYQLKAGILVGEGKLAEGAREYEKLLAVNPNFAIAYNNLGYYSMGMGDYARSEDYLKRYRFLAPDQANPFDSLGELYANTGRYDDARASLQQALKVKPDFAPSIAHLGTVAAGEGNFLEAGEKLRQAISMADGPERRFDWGVGATIAFALAGHPEEAEREIAAMEDAARRMPEAQQKKLLARMQLVRAVLDAQSGRLAEAEKLFDEAKVTVAAEPKPDSKEAPGSWASAVHVVRGLILRAKGDDAAAVEELKAGLNTDGARSGGFDYFPQQDLFRVDLAESLASLGRTEEAQKALAPILERNPKFQPALDAAKRHALAVPAVASAGR